MSVDLTTLSIVEARAGLRSGQFSAIELTQSYLNRIKALNQTVKAYLRVTEEQALESAQAADQAIQKGQDGALWGFHWRLKMY